MLKFGKNLQKIFLVKTLEMVESNRYLPELIARRHFLPKWTRGKKSHKAQKCQLQRSKQNCNFPNDNFCMEKKFPAMKKIENLIFLTND